MQESETKIQTAIATKIQLTIGQTFTIKEPDRIY